MKMKNFMAMMMAACVMVMGAASCDEDEDEEPVVEESAAQMMAGTYTGEYILTVMGSADTAQVEMTINKLSEDSIQLVTPAAGSGAMALPSLTCNLKAVKDEDSYSAVAESVSGTIIVNDVEKAYTFSKVAVAVEGNGAGISYSLQYGKMPMAMVVTFKGEK